MLIPDVNLSFGEQYVDFRCARCGVTAQASVRVTGAGFAMGGVSLTSAELDARAAAARMALLAPCPRCGHRSTGALAKVLLVGASVGALAAMAAGLAVAEQLRASDPGGDAALQVGLATFLAVVAIVAALKLRSVRRRVRFHRPG